LLRRVGSEQPYSLVLLFRDPQGLKPLSLLLLLLLSLAL
jgi:hypothetical protein